MADMGVYVHVYIVATMTNCQHMSGQAKSNTKGLTECEGVCTDWIMRFIRGVGSLGHAQPCHSQSDCCNW